MTKIKVTHRLSQRRAIYLTEVKDRTADRK